MTLLELTRRYLNGLIPWDEYRAEEKRINAAQRLATAHSNVRLAIRADTVTDEDFRKLGDAYGDYVKARTGR